jgi:replicative DNA helicase
MMRNISKDILSACMFDSDNMAICLERGVIPEWFETDGGVFRELTKLYAETKWDKRSSINVLEAAGLFAKFPDSMEMAANTPDWSFDVNEVDGAVDVLAGEFVKRSLTTSLVDAHGRLMHGDDPYDVSGCLAATLEVLEKSGHNDDITTEELAQESMEIDRKIASGERLGLPFPWINLQRQTFGIPHGSVSPLAGRDGAGKSRLSTFLTHFWINQGIPCMYFAFEDGRNRFMSNLASNHGQYDMFNIKRHHVPTDFLSRHENCLMQVGKMPITVSDKFDTVEGIVSAIAKEDRRLKSNGYERGLEGVVIDGLKDIIHSGGDGSVGEEDHISACLTACARKYGPAIIPVSHLTDLEDDKWISKRNIRGSKKQSQNARQVMIYQDAGIPSSIKAKFDFPYDVDAMVFQVAKSSYGERGYVPLVKDLENGRFIEIKPIGE